MCICIRTHTAVPPLPARVRPDVGLLPADADTVCRQYEDDDVEWRDYRTQFHVLVGRDHAARVDMAGERFKKVRGERSRDER